LNVLLALTYYRPHISGLTIYAERLARALAGRGHRVTVLTSHYSADLPREETLAGIRVVRVPVAFRLSKGVIMPLYGFYATRLALENDVLSVHLPQFDAWGLALRGRVLKKPVVLTYHCDLMLPGGLFNRFVEQVTFGANYLATRWADRIVANTQEYAESSRLLRRFLDKVEPILPPVTMAAPADEDVRAFRRRHGLEGRRTAGFVARFASEKGVEVLVDAMPELTRRYPDLKVMFAGPYQDVIGEESYRERLFPRIRALGDAWQFAGTLTDAEMPAFYASLDCLLVPSLNTTESFGMVQVEAMLCGTPVVASDLPGVRQPVLMTGMGEVAPAGDPAALAEALSRVLDDRARYVRPRAEIEGTFGVEQTVDAYERLFEREIARKRAGRATARVETKV
jgi:glycosyltransferase involved in cell wall biosynthesis